MLEYQPNASVTKIKVIGVGGGGSNAINRMVAQQIKGVEFIAINTDQQALNFSSAQTKIIIGEEITHGQGAGANPEIGRQSAEASEDAIRQVLNDTDMVFITTGMGGGTGTGAAPIIARIAKEMGILTVGIVTKPFAFEGRRRMLQAENGIQELKKHVDSLIVIPNERLKQVSATSITLFNAFEIADSVLLRGVSSVTKLINSNGYINLDFADVTSVMKNAGYAHMGIGEGKGENKAQQAATQAISSPLLETTIDGAHGVLVNITISEDTSLDDVEIASQMITESAHPDANIIWGTTFDSELSNEMHVTIIATGFDSQKPEEVVQAPVQTVQAEVQPTIQSAPAVETPSPSFEHPSFSSPKASDVGIPDDDFDVLVDLLKKKH